MKQDILSLQDTITEKKNILRFFLTEQVKRSKSYMAKTVTHSTTTKILLFLPAANIALLSMPLIFTPWI